MSWQAYLRSIKNAENPNIDGRLAVLAKARELFSNSSSFADMEPLERKAIAGFIGSNQVQEESSVQGLGWGWFGSMEGAGVFKNRINEGNKHISLALEHIPVSGAINEDDYLAFASEYVKAYDNSPRVGGLPTASRLLAMKRPDYFVCVDQKNQAGLAADLGFTQNQLDLESYWDLVVLPIVESNWWNVRRPSGLNGKIWECRAAMLDVIYYDWS